MSNTTDKMLDRYVYLKVDLHPYRPPQMTIQVKLDDEGVVVDAWQDDESVASSWKTYNDMGVEVKEIKDE